MALNLSRADDVEAMPAWVGREFEEPVWDAVAEHAATITAAEGVALAQLLGVPAAVAIAPEEFDGPSVTVDAHDAPVGSPRDPAPTVVDLSALWAGPLCARLIGAALGARVLKVEHIGRPDGARAGPPAFWRSLNSAKEERHLDLATTTGRAELSAVLAHAKVIVSAARPRALTNLGLDLAQLAARGAIWVSITGYGLTGERVDWVAFGDDAAVAGGLAVVGGSYDAPEFVGDAVADPLSGLAAAVVAVRLARARRAGVVDVAMAGVVNRAVFPPR
jgi:crotonobetainyl-CoA:carnitine CoA-transferase CaiB-like acyl-CoA transferase